QRNAGTNRVWTRAVAMALLKVFYRVWVVRSLVVRLEALMTSASELNFYTVLLTFRAKCREFAAKLARYFRNIAGNAIKFITLKNTAGR
ncbi:hypothetical protein, partial [Shewanella algae]|uniref:hypothetical protein n=1 Tax=Shewanella algae TaxID=38313 RepID=UPI003004E0DA